MRQSAKSVRRALREMAAAAHEEELRRALLPIAAAHDDWRAGELGSGELAGRIHEFHQGPAREVYKRYNSGPLEFSVARAVVSGVLERERVPADVLEHCHSAIEFLTRSS